MAATSECSIRSRRERASSSADPENSTYVPGGRATVARALRAVATSRDGVVFPLTFIEIVCTRFPASWRTSARPLVTPISATSRKRTNTPVAARIGRSPTSAGDVRARGSMATVIGVTRAPSNTSPASAP
jgi:hypothetical protein